MSGQANFRVVEMDVAAPAGADPHQVARVRADLVFELDRRDRQRRDRLIDFALESAIVLLTLAALWLVTSSGPYARWGHVAGLASQPLYIAATWRARRWGMFIVAVMTCGIWLRGIVNHFF